MLSEIGFFFLLSEEEFGVGGYMNENDGFFFDFEIFIRNLVLEVI